MEVGSRTIPLSRGSHVIGSQVLPTGRVEHESALERDFVILAGFCDAMVKVVAQPVTIHFDDCGRRRRYTPDFQVAWSDGRCELVEIKYRSDLRRSWRCLRPGFAAARTWANERSMRFRIATERGIRGSILENAKRLLPLRRAPVDAALAERAVALAAAGDCTFDELRRELSGDNVQATGAIWRLIAKGVLHADFSTGITGSTRLWAP
jgi:hypothetical protein